MIPVVAIVVTHDSAGKIGACLDALTVDGIPVIVVDNASRDDTCVLAAARGARIVANVRNEGYGRAMNRGVAHAGDAAFCLLMNPDLRVAPGAVAALLDAAQRYPDAAMFGPRLIEPDGRLFHPRRSLLSPPHLNAGSEPDPEAECCTPFLSGACLLVRREPFQHAGGFDPRIFLFYEDDDLCRRLRDAGHALVHVAGAVAHHERGTSAAAAPGRTFRSRWHQAWSRGYVSRKYGLRSYVWRVILINGLKFAGVWLLRDKAGMERYGGSVAGAWAVQRGREALGREGLTAQLSAAADDAGCGRAAGRG